MRSADGSGCSADNSKNVFLITVNKARQSRAVDLPVEETALARCAEFQPLAPAMGTMPMLNAGVLHIEEAAESMMVYELQ